MAYTVKNLSELSGVTVRTLHFYEEEGLLQPAYYGKNGYRYYEDKQLLQLQQILFFKELGFTIEQIKKVLSKSGFDQLATLLSHKKSLKEQWQRLGTLLETIDKTINYLHGKTKMKDKDFFDGFKITTIKKAPKQAPYAADETTVLESLRGISKEPAEVLLTAVALLQEVTCCLEKNLSPSSPIVQAIISRHHASTDELHYATQNVYKALANLYASHPAFKEQLLLFHPKLPKFMSEAMLFFADSQLE